MSAGVCGDVKTTLKRVALFETLDDASLEMLAARARCFRQERGTLLFREGDEGDEMLIILEGACSISVRDENGHQFIIGVVGAGGILGELAVIDQQARSATATAVEDCDLVAVDRRTFANLAHEQPDLLLAVAKNIARMLRASTRNLVDLTSLALKHLEAERTE